MGRPAPSTAHPGCERSPGAQRVLDPTEGDRARAHVADERPIVAGRRGDRDGIRSEHPLATERGHDPRRRVRGDDADHVRRSRSAARTSDAAPKWRPSRTATAPMPASCALAIARSVARAAVTMPSAPCPSTSAVATDSRTTSNGALGLHVPVAQARARSRGGRTRCAMPWVSNPRRSASTSSSAATPASSGRDAERLEHAPSRTCAATRAAIAWLRHGRPACGTSTRIVRITPVAVPGT